MFSSHSNNRKLFGDELQSQLNSKKRCYYSSATEHEKVSLYPPYLSDPKGMAFSASYIHSQRAGFLPAEIAKPFKTSFCIFKEAWSFIIHIDDSYLLGNDFADCVTNVIVTMKLFDSFGFVIHPLGSVLVRSLRVTYLRLVLD